MNTIVFPQTPARVTSPVISVYNQDETVSVSVKFQLDGQEQEIVVDVDRHLPEERSAEGFSTVEDLPANIEEWADELATVAATLNAREWRNARYDEDGDVFNLADADQWEEQLDARLNEVLQG